MRILKSPTDHGSEMTRQLLVNPRPLNHAEGHLVLLASWLMPVDLSHRAYVSDFPIDNPSRCRLPQLSVLRTENRFVRFVRRRGRS